MIRIVFHRALALFACMSAAAAPCASSSAAPVSHLAPPRAAPPTAPSLRAHVLVQPALARIFAGADLQFTATAAGAGNADVVWSTFGPGAADETGLYHSPPDAAGETGFVVATIGSASSASRFIIVAPPADDAPLAVVSCYDGGALDVLRTAVGGAPLEEFGMASAGETAGGIAASGTTRHAFAAVGDRIVDFDVADGSIARSDPVSGARFSEIAAVGDGFLVATDNNAGAGQNGVRVFSTEPKPALVASAPAGDTPEGIAVAGNTIYITNVNSDSVMRFRMGERGRLRLTGASPTGHRPFGVAVDEARKLLFVADNDTATISGSASRPGLEVFALPSLRLRKRITTGSPDALPLGVVADASADRVFVTNEGDGDVVAYQASTLRRVALIRTGRTPWLPAIDTRAGRLYVPDAQDSAIVTIDLRTLRPIGSATPTCGYPTSIALLPALSRPGSRR